MTLKFMQLLRLPLQADRPNTYSASLQISQNQPSKICAPFHSKPLPALLSLARLDGTTMHSTVQSRNLGLFLYSSILYPLPQNAQLIINFQPFYLLNIFLVFVYCHHHLYQLLSTPQFIVPTMARVVLIYIYF